MRKKAMWPLGIIVAAMACSEGSLAAVEPGEQTGTVTSYLLNNRVINRGACIKLNPPLPHSGFACVWRESAPQFFNALYREIDDLWREAFLAQKTCTVTWQRIDEVTDTLVVDSTECFQ
jgi:hypothetical protein